MRITPILSMLLGVACAAPMQSFHPTGPGIAQGELAAGYEVRDASGRVAQVNVWSQGAYLDAQGSTRVDVGLEVQNVGAEPVSLDTESISLEAFDGAGAPLPPPQLLGIYPVEPAGPAAPGPAAVSPERAGRFVLSFALAPGAPPDAIASLRLRWALVQAGDRRYVQFTDFARDVDRPAGAVYAYVPIIGFYDPYVAWWWPGFFWTGVHVAVPHHVPVRRVMVAPHHRRR